MRLVIAITNLFSYKKFLFILKSSCQIRFIYLVLSEVFGCKRYTETVGNLKIGNK